MAKFKKLHTAQIMQQYLNPDMFKKPYTWHPLTAFYKGHEVMAIKKTLKQLNEKYGRGDITKIQITMDAHKPVIMVHIRDKDQGDYIRPGHIDKGQRGLILQFLQHQKIVKTII